jgi:hypothetical protein
MAFFQAQNGRSYPVNRIVAIHPAKNNTTEVEIEGGAVVIAYPAEIERLERRAVTSFPAQPGTFIVSRSNDADADEDQVWKTPVVGWCVAANGTAYPITIDGVNDDAGDQCLSVLMPDGTVVERFTVPWPSLDTWIAASKERDGRWAKRA